MVPPHNAIPEGEDRHDDGGGGGSDDDGGGRENGGGILCWHCKFMILKRQTNNMHAR